MNQREMSAISGPKVVAEPAPISNPWTSVNCTIEPVTEASRKPAPSIRDAMRAGFQKPILSTSRPTRTLPRAKPSIVAV